MPPSANQVYHSNHHSYGTCQGALLTTTRNTFPFQGTTESVQVEPLAPHFPGVKTFVRNHTTGNRHSLVVSHPHSFSCTMGETIVHLVCRKATETEWNYWEKKVTQPSRIQVIWDKEDEAKWFLKAGNWWAPLWGRAGHSHSGKLKVKTLSPIVLLPKTKQPCTHLQPSSLRHTGYILLFSVFGLNRKPLTLTLFQHYNNNNLPEESFRAPLDPGLGTGT